MAELQPDGWIGDLVPHQQGDVLVTDDGVTYVVIGPRVVGTIMNYYEYPVVRQEIRNLLAQEREQR